MTRSRPERAFDRFLGVVARIVPSAQRERWMREWKGEIGYVLARGPSRGEVLRLCFRTSVAFIDALSIRIGGISVKDWLSNLVRTLRSLGKSPTFTLVFVATLALGIGASTTVFSLANWALLRPLPGVDSPDDLVEIRSTLQEREGFIPFSFPMIRRVLDDDVAGLASVASFASMTVDWTEAPEDRPSRAPAQVVTEGYFETLGVSPYLGRLFTDVEFDPTTIHRVLVVSESFWNDRLGRDPEVLGRTVRVNGSAYRIVGVLDPDFSGTERTSAIELWFPVSTVSEVLPRTPPGALTMERAFLFPSLIGRLAPGALPSNIGPTLAARWPELATMGATPNVSRGVGLSPGLQARVANTLWVLGGLVSLLLLLTVANLTNLILSRLARRRNESLLRKALGASFLRLTAGLMGEAAVLASLGSAIALLGTGLVLRLLDGARWFNWFPPISGVPLDIRVLSFSFASAVGSAFLATLGTAWVFQRLAPAQALRSGSGAARPVGVVRKGLVSLQAGLSLCILVSAGLLVRSFDGLHRVDMGIEPEGVALFSLNPGAQGYSDDESDRLFRDLKIALESLPEVEAVGFSWLAPFGAQRYSEQVSALGQGGDGEVVSTPANMLTPGMLEALGMDMVEGRGFDEREYLATDRPERGDILVSRSLAELLFPGENAVGREVHMPGRTEAAFEVIGVVEDARIIDVREQGGPYLFDPFGNGYRTSSVTFAVRGSGEVAVLQNSIRERIRALYPNLTVFDERTFAGRIADTLVEERMMARMTSAFAILALILASVGIYGLVSESVQARVREFGIRVALGARRGQVVRVVVRESLLLVAVGSVVGLFGAAQISRILEPRLYEVNSLDPLTFAFATVAMIGIAWIASWIPAVRSARIDPARTLRGE